MDDVAEDSPLPPAALERQTASASYVFRYLTLHVNVERVFQQYQSSQR